MIGPRVSVIVPVKDGARYLGEALDSVRRQDFPGVEVLVVDDGSSDPTAELARARGDVRLIQGRFGGCAAARNAGVAVARGELYAFLDHDDRWAAGKLALQVGFLDAHPHVAWAVARMENFLEPGCAEPAWCAGGSGKVELGLVPGTLVVRRAAFEQVGPFDPAFTHGSDTEWFFRAKDSGLTFVQMREVLLHRRVHDRNLSAGREPEVRILARILKASMARQRARPRVAVIVPVRDRAHLLARALESVVAQREPRAEVVVVDDGSTDGSADVARRFPGVRVVTLTGEGVAAARNAGIAATTAPLVAFLDSDDCWAPDKLARQLAHLDAHPDQGYCLARMQNLLEPGVSVPAWIAPADLDRPVIGAVAGTLVVRRAVLERVGGFDPSFAIAEDVDWFCRAKDAGVAFGILPDVLLERRIHGGNLTAGQERSREPLLRALKASLDRRRR